MRAILCVVLVIAAAAIHGCSGSSSAQTARGLIEELVVPGIPRDVVRLDSGLTVFLMSDDVSGNEPWVSDGTPEGTFQLMDTIVGNSGGVLGSSSSRPALFTTGDRAYFFSQLGDLWTTDGTIPGTVVFLDLSPTDLYFSPHGVFEDGNELLVTGCEGGIDGTPVISDCSIMTILLD